MTVADYSGQDLGLEEKQFHFEVVGGDGGWHAKGFHILNQKCNLTSYSGHGNPVERIK